MFLTFSLTSVIKITGCNKEAIIILRSRLIYHFVKIIKVLVNTEAVLMNSHLMKIFLKIFYIKICDCEDGIHKILNISLTVMPNLKILRLKFYYLNLDAKYLCIEYFRSKTKIEFTQLFSNP